MNNAQLNLVWKNYPSDESPVNEQNLNSMVRSINLLNENTTELDIVKATKEEVAPLIQEVAFDEKTGIFTITRKNGAKFTIDTKLEKIAVNFDYDPMTQKIILYLIDGTVQYIDLSALITQYEFLDTDTVSFFIDSNGRVSAIVKDGSIEEKHLRPNYLAEIKIEASKAQASEASAASSEANAKNSAILAESYAHGGTGTRTGEDSDNAMEYARQAKASAEKANEVISQSVIPQSEKGVANGVATLDNAGKVPTSQLPSTYGEVTGVKGNSETTYRTGNVNLTPENIGAVSADDLTTSIGTVGLSAAGWYRIAEYIAFSDVGMQGASGTSCTISIKRHYNNTNNEYHKVELLGIFQKAEFKDVSNKSNTQIITKIRNVYDNGHLFLEIYYSSSGTNDIDITIENARAGAQIWKVIDPVVTSETMNGATVYASMDLSANSHGSVTSATVAESSTKVNGHTVDSDVPANAKFTDTKVISTVAFSGNLGLSETKYITIPNISQYDLIVMETTEGNIVFASTSGVMITYVFEYTSSVSSITLTAGMTYINENTNQVVINVPYNYKIGSGAVARSAATNMALLKVTAYRFNSEVV